MAQGRRICWKTNVHAGSSLGHTVFARGKQREGGHEGWGSWRAVVVLYSFLCLLFVVRDLEFGERSVLWVLFSSYFVAVL